MSFFRHPFRSLFCALTGRTLVALQDFDGEVVVRCARPNSLGGLIAQRFGLGLRTVALLTDGTVDDLIVERWVAL